MSYVLKEFHSGNQNPNQLLDPQNRMRPLDVVKVLLGVQSSRECVKRYQNDSKVWAGRHDYDYAQLLELSQAVVSTFYVDALSNMNFSKNKRVH